MLHDESALFVLDGLKVQMLFVLLHDFRAPRCGGTANAETLLVQHGEDAGDLLRKEPHDRAVVGEVEGFPSDTLFVVQSRFILENEGVEVLLQHLIREIDGQLFKGIFLEEFEAEDVEDTAGNGFHMKANGLIRSLDQVKEHSLIDEARQRVSAILRLLARVLHYNDAISRRLHRPGTEGGSQACSRHAQKVGHRLYWRLSIRIVGVRACCFRRLASNLCEIDVAEVQHSRDAMEDV
mmetsp:Transcript_28882/g.76206  ORF Transcript_28882/g.76206 Transcript_28882/m.76206 type:complete len:237 (+) Transcript_28882:1561-2271(+)